MKGARRAGLAVTTFRTLASAASESCRTAISCSRTCRRGEEKCKIDREERMVPTADQLQEPWSSLQSPVARAAMEDEAARESSNIISVISFMMAASDSVTSIPVHRSTLEALRSAKSAAQTWDDFLLALADDYIAPALKRELDRRLKSEPVVSGAEMKQEFRDWRRLRART